MTQLITAVMIVKDGACTIGQSIESLRLFNEALVYDTGSTDQTKKIAVQYPNVRLLEGEFEGFGPTKNKAVALAKHDWILIIDSDECVEPELAEAIHRKELDPNIIYLLNFKAFYKHYQVRHCGWNNQKIRRLYNRKKTHFTNNCVHENLIDTGMRLENVEDGNILHYSYHSLSDFIMKVDRYSTLFAESNKGKQTASPGIALASGVYSFFRTYVLKRGFLDGYVGLVIAFSHMATNFYKYMKLYESNSEQNASRRHD
jgi:glycosyltransferase involved in cell wall biosynthesis